SVQPLHPKSPLFPYTTLFRSSLCTSGKTVTIGELLDLSSSLADQGTRAKDSSVLAINDINSLLSSGGCTGLKFATAVVDYGLRRSEEHTSESSHVSTSYAVFC